jgi:LmbE family N-acetylglucosaminyl deacetylase
MPRVLALFAHPDDIEFRATGTLLLLREQGWQLHYCNLSNGNLGSAEMSMTRTASVRKVESQKAARALGAVWHPSLCGDLQVLYTPALLKKVCALIRSVNPDVLLTHPPQDYMEDHMNTCRLAVSGAFARGIPNYRTTPNRAPTLTALTIYHSVPHGLVGPLRGPAEPEGFVDVTSVQAQKRDLLACHHSQKHWLDLTQGSDSYLKALDSEGATLGKRSGKFRFAEGWTRHLHLGFGAESDHPLREVLGKRYCDNRRFAKG